MEGRLFSTSRVAFVLLVGILPVQGATTNSLDLQTDVSADVDAADLVGQDDADVEQINEFQRVAAEVAARQKGMNVADVLEVLGVGSSAAMLLYENAMLAYNSLEVPPTIMRYQSVNSDTGACRIRDYYSYCDWDHEAEPYADFAATETPLSPEDYLRWPDLLTFPTVAQAVVMVVNIEGYDMEAPNLILDRETTVGIFSGNITMWDDERIKRLQSEYVSSRLPSAKITVVVRKDVSGTTDVFKKTLAKFDPDYGALISDLPNTEWTNINPLRFRGNLGVASGVIFNSNSIGYTDLATADAMALMRTAFQQNQGAVVQAGMLGIEYAMFEKGVVLDPVYNTADLMDARGDNAWPITTYTYAIIRTNIRGDRLRQGATCGTVRQLMLFWDWFLSSPHLEEVLAKYASVSMAKSTQEDVLKRLKSVYCESKPIKQADFATGNTGELLTGLGAHIAAPVMELQFLAYSLVDDTANLDFTPNATSTVDKPLNTTEAWRVVVGNDVFQQDWFKNNQYDVKHDLIKGQETYIALPWYLTPLVVIYHLPSNYISANDQLVLDRRAIVDLLNGEIITWDNSHINRLNPWLADRYLDTVILMMGLETEDDVMYQMLFKLLQMPSGISVKGRKRTNMFSSYLQIIQAVENTEGSVAVIPYTALDSQFVRYAHINLVDMQRENAVELSFQSLQQCVGAGSFNPFTFEFQKDVFSVGANNSLCYQLSMPVYVIARYSYADENRFCNNELSPGWQTTAFVRHLFLEETAETNIIHTHSLPLTYLAGHAEHISQVEAALKYMPCGFAIPVNTDNTAFMMFIIILGGSGFVFLLLSTVALACYCQRLKRLKLNPLYGVDVNRVLADLHQALLEETGGNVATYIPQLAAVDPDLFGIGLMTVEGKLFKAGDSEEPFSIQSISKPFLYAFGISYNGFAMMREKVGVEPSGEAFNSEKMGPGNKPFNPYINAGAIATVGMLPFGDTEERYEIIRKYMSDLSFFGDLELDEDVYESETKSADQNRLIGQVLLEHNIVPSEYDMEHGLEAYFMACSTLVTTVDLATMGAVLANAGKHPTTKLDLIAPDIVDEVVSVMMTCGMYNGAGNWMIDVGVPAKSGVSGGIMAVVPNVGAIAVYSPRLNEHYNSVRKG